MPDINYISVATPEDYLKCVTIRSMVFMDEQGTSFYAEFDEYDLKATHFLVTVDDEPAGTARVRTVGGYAKIERLGVRKNFRNIGLGKGVVECVLKHIDKLGHQKTLLNSPINSTGFYEKFGFIKEGKEFIESDLPLRRMTRTIEPQ